MTTCAATIKLGDGRTLTCELSPEDAGHPEGVHRDGDNAWHYGVILPNIE